MAEISNYHVTLFGTPNTSYNIEAQIYLYGSTGNIVGQIKFSKDGVAPSKDLITSNGIIAMYMSYSHLSNVLDVLRNEKPCSVGWNQSTGLGFLHTGLEPIGEAE